MFKKLIEKPYRLMAIFGCFYLIISIVLNLMQIFNNTEGYNSFSHIWLMATEAVSLVLCGLTFVFYNKHYIYFIVLELLVFSNIFAGEIYTALFLSSFLLFLILTENKKISRRFIILFCVIEVVKAIFVIPHGVTEFFYYIGLNLFALCTICCVNLLFRHAYNIKDDEKINLDEIKLTERQKNCIKEIVLYNTTIKALAINHNVSESAIKKDLAHIYKLLGISGKADLKALFIDYRF